MMTTPYDPIRQHGRGLLAASLIIILLALLLRVVLIAERAAFDPQFIPQPGTDQQTYLEQAHGLLDGTWPDGPFYYHPAPAYFFAALLRIHGDSLILLHLSVALFDALTCGILIAAGWLLGRRPATGYVAGLLYAIYPVAIMYGTTLLIAPMAAFLLALLCWLILWQREKLHIGRSALIGITGGAIALARLNLAPVAGLWILYLLLRWPGWRIFLQHSLITLVCALCTIAPATLWNAQASGGRFIPVATTGPLELYIANNRDADGSRASSAAFETRDISYEDALMRDIALAPERFAGLLLRKFGLFWADLEPANNISYAEQRELSTLLQSLPFSFVWLAGAGLLSLALLWREDRWLAMVFGLLIAWVCVGVVIGFAFSRLRYPVIIPLLLLSAYGLLRVPGLSRQDWRGVLLPGIAIAALLIFPAWALGGEVPPLPPKRIYTQLPADAIQLDARFGEELTLRGWRTVPQWPAAERGWVEPSRAYTVELFWEVEQPTTANYDFYIAYIDDGTRYAGIDRRIGTVSYPPAPTSLWQVGQIMGEIVSVRMPDTAPLARSARIELGVYRLESPQAPGQLLPVPLSQPFEAPALLLQRLAVFIPTRIPEAPTDLQAVGQIYGTDGGPRLQLEGIALPEHISAGETFPIRLSWLALEAPRFDYNMFIHLADQTGQIVSQADGPPNPELLTANWLPAYPVTSTVFLSAPSEAGEYDLYIGLTEALTGARLSTNAPDDRPLISRLRVDAAPDTAP